MKNTFLKLSLVLTIGFTSYGCSASDTTGTSSSKSANDFAKDSSNAVHSLGKAAGDAGDAIKSSFDELPKNNNLADKNSDQSKNLQRNASNALNTLGKEIDQGEHALATAVKKNIGENKNVHSISSNSKKVDGQNMHGKAGAAN